MKNQSFSLAIFVFAVAFLTTTGTYAIADSDNLGMLTLDQLLDVEVVSVAKVPEKIRNTPAAIQVITQEDLRRSGVNSIPEALRLVPGMHVYRIDANKWAISARGFTSQFSNKMLVMIDGRTVYSPLFSGVYWDVQDMMLEDIDRIEVIRGPGGSLWGTNAVNGVINIISKDSADTQGGLVSMEGSQEDKNQVAAHYGGWLDSRTSYRLYGKYFYQDNFKPTDFGNRHQIAIPNKGADDYHSTRGGFRLDRNQNRSNKLTLQGDIYRGSSGSNLARPQLSSPILFVEKEDEDVSGGNLLGRWQHIFSPDSDITVQVYYDNARRKQTYLHTNRNTLDCDFQYRFPLLDRHEILWGMGYRYTKDNLKTYDVPGGFYYYRFDPRSRSNNLYTGFIQDRYHFADDRGELTLGTKIEHNDYTGMEWQPSIRFLWKFNEQHSCWAAISRSVRTPSRLEHDGSVNTKPLSNSLGIPIVPRLVSNGHLDSEKLLTYEIGYKSRLLDNFSMDITAYYNSYNHLAAGFSTGMPFIETDTSTPYLVVPTEVSNEFDAETFGIELSTNLSITDWWRLSTGFSWFENNFLDENGYTDPRSEFQEDNESTYQLSLTSYMDLPGNLELNSLFFYVDELEEMGIDQYTRFDLNIVWHAGETLTLTLGGRNLFDSNHDEYDSITSGVYSSRIPRSFYGKLDWRF